MLNMDIGEIVLILLVAFLVVGPKDLPRVARWIGRMVRKSRDFIREFKKEIGWDEITKEFHNTTDDVKDTLRSADISGEIQGASKEVRRTFMDMKADMDKMDKEMKNNAK